MIDSTWIPLMRQFTDCAFYNNSVAVQVFLHIFLNAKNEEKVYGNDLIMRGQFLTSITAISSYLELSRRKVRDVLDKLKSLNVIHVLSQRRKGIIITVRDYDKFLNLQNLHAGWIKLYHGIDAEEWFVNAELVHVYLHIMLNSYPDHFNNIDYSWFNMHIMTAKLGLPVRTIRKCILKLRDLGILDVSYENNNKFSSLVLTDYPVFKKKVAIDTYLRTHPSLPLSTPEEIDEEDIHEEGKPEVTSFPIKHDKSLSNFPDFPCPKNTQKKTNKQPINDQIKFSSKTQNIDNKNSPIVSESDSLASIGLKEVQIQSTPNSEIVVTKTTEEDSKSIYARDPINIENRDKRIENRDNIIIINKHAHKKNFLDELLEDPNWIQSMAVRFHLTSKVIIKNTIKLFLAELGCRGIDVPSTKFEFLDYLCNWLKRNYLFLKKINTNQAAIVPNADGFQQHEIVKDKKIDAHASLLQVIENKIKNGENLRSSPLLFMLDETDRIYLQNKFGISFNQRNKLDLKPK